MNRPRTGGVARLATLSRIIARRSRAGTLGFAIAAAAVGATVVSFAVAGPPRDAPPSQRPAGEVKAGAVNVPAGTTPLTVAEIGEGKEIAGMRVLPPGAVPSYDWQDRQGADEARVPVQGIDGPEAASLTRHVVQPPPGFVLDGGGFVAAVAKDGSRRTLQEFYTLTSADQWPIQVEVIGVAPGGKPDVVMYSPETGRTAGLYSHGRVGVVVSYGLPGAALQAVLEAYFTIGGSFFHIHAPGLPAATLLSIVDRLIEANQ